MIGSSWGGFNALQIAALRPPALAAIITNCSTDDRYTDDMHYMGGALLNDTLDWGSSFFARLPGRRTRRSPARTGAQKWQARLDSLALPLAVWLRHQRRDGYWKHGSVNEDYAAIECPVFATGGWMDGYSNAIPRLLADLSVPRLGLIGAVGPQVRPPGRAGAGDRLPARSASAGSTTGSRAGTPASCASRCCGPSCRRRCRRGRLRGLPRALGRRAGLAAAAPTGRGGSILGARRRAPGRARALP